MVSQLFNCLNGVWKVADSLVAFEAHRQGISKDDAWAGAAAAAQIHGDQAFELMADLFDPLGWRAAARALNHSA